jgi:murein DD-endopeptidase MepM/ murein hydrolase activator NlpD
MKTLLSACIGVALSLGAVASTPSYAATPQTARSITVSDLIYTSEEMENFSTRGYLAKRAPHLILHAEIIEGSAAHTRISPKVLIALMEQESGIVSRRRANPNALIRPFGKLSTKNGFRSQILDVAERLQGLVQSQRGAALSAKAGFSAIDPIQAIYSQSGKNPNAAGFSGRVQFPSTYANLFNEIWGTEAKPNVLDRVSMKAIPSTTLLALPYAVGSSYSTLWGPHPNASSSIMSSIDFKMPAGSKILASAAGTVTVHGTCGVTIKHGTSGWSTYYYHIKNIAVKQGQSIVAGTYIGTPSDSTAQATCQGGSWGGTPHLHWTLYYNNAQNSLNGVTLSGYKMTVTSTTAYDPNCALNYLTRSSTKYCFAKDLLKRF